MTHLPLTPEVLAAAYDYLAACEPFVRWNLPDSDDVKFKVTRSKKEYARYQWDGGRHVISVSAAAVGHTSTLLMYLSHEILHMHLEITGMESRTGDENTHNMPFRRLAAQVCRVHGFDLKAFY